MSISVADLQPASHDLFHGTAAALRRASVLGGVDSYKVAEVAGKPLPEGALLLEDMGLLPGAWLQHCIDQGAYVVTRVPARAAVFGEKGGGIDLVKQLRTARG